MNDTHKDSAPKSPGAESAGFTDAELTAAVRKAVQEAPDRDTQSRIDRKVAEALKDAKLHSASNDPPFGL
jgi:hypothetical protein